MNLVQFRKCANKLGIKELSQITKLIKKKHDLQSTTQNLITSDSAYKKICIMLHDKIMNKAKESIKKTRDSRRLNFINIFKTSKKFTKLRSLSPSSATKVQLTEICEMDPQIEDPRIKIFRMGLKEIVNRREIRRI